MFKWLRKFFSAPVAQIAAPVPAPRSGMKIGASALSQFPSTDPNGDGTRDAVMRTFNVPKPFPGVVPKSMKMALDDANMNNLYSYAAMEAVYAEGLQFMGYSYLSELAQRPEYRRPAEILAKEMTRKWIKLQSTGDSELNDKTDKLKVIEAELTRLEVQARFREAIEQDGFFGRSQIFIDMGLRRDDEKELATPLHVHKNKITPRTPIKRLLVIEPMWTYPNNYNASDPLNVTFYRPQTWFMMGKEIHTTRLLTIVTRKVPDILKPAYAFGGLSLSQMMKPYVDNWLRTRQSVSDIIHSYSLFVLKTNLTGVLNGGAAEEMLNRATLFNQTRDNKGLQILDNDTEDFSNVSAPLGSLDKLQAQAQEHQSAVSGIPLTKLLGITPAGLNATSEGEEQAFYDWLHSQQEGLSPQLKRIIDIIQLYKFGEIDPEITFIWQPLEEMSEKERADIRKQEADTDVALIGVGVIDPGEARARLAGQEDSPYASLDINKEIVPPGAEDPLAEAGIGGPEDPNEDPAAQLGNTEANAAADPAATLHPIPAAAGKSRPKALAGDEARNFEENQHPRDDSGQFSAGSGGGGAAPAGGKKSATAHLVPAPANRSEWPEHVKGLKIPPAWKDVKISSDPKAGLLAIGTDEKGRRQPIYSDEHHMKQDALKHARVAELSKKIGEVMTENEKARKSDDPVKRDTADVFKLVTMTGLRPGSDEDTKAAKKAYGATTLEGRHVIPIENGAVELHFTGKSGKDLVIHVGDKATATMLKERAKTAGEGGKLFPKANRNGLLDYVKSLDGGGFKTKDVRTLIGTSTAQDAVKAAPAPKTMAEYKKAVRAVAVAVSEKLGNTPAVALQKYINPAVFAEWKSKVE